MDLYDDIFNVQLLQLSPLRFCPSPEPFTSLTVYFTITASHFNIFLYENSICDIDDANKVKMLALCNIKEFLLDPLVEEAENVDGEAVGFIENSAITEANRTMGVQSPNLVLFPERLPLVQNQSDQQLFLNQNMLNSSFVQEPGVFAMVK